MASSSPTQSTLPDDLIRIILHMLPAESLVRLRLTCRQLRDLINDKKFIYDHLDRSKVRFLRTDQTVQIVDPENGTRSDSPIPGEFQPDSISKILAMVHCDGLMLCSWRYTKISSFVKLALWNPLTRNINLVEPNPDTYPKFELFDYFGIGYVNKKSVRDYKILRFSVRRYDGEEVEIYECNSKSWRILDVAKVVSAVYPTSNGVSVMGNMYWLAKKKPRNYILGFDFSLETFKEICVCPCDTYDLFDGNYLGSYGRDRLSFLEQDDDNASSIEVWVSSKLADGNVSFRQHFRVSRPDLPELHPPTFSSYPVYYCTSEHKRIIAWCARDRTGMILCEIGEGGVISERKTEQDYKDDYYGTRFCGYIYVPSLVSLP